MHILSLNRDQVMKLIFFTAWARILHSERNCSETGRTKSKLNEGLWALLFQKISFQKKKLMLWPLELFEYLSPKIKKAPLKIAYLSDISFDIGCTTA